MNPLRLILDAIPSLKMGQIIFPGGLLQYLEIYLVVIIEWEGSSYWHLISTAHGSCNA